MILDLNRVNFNGMFISKKYVLVVVLETSIITQSAAIYLILFFLFLLKQ